MNYEAITIEENQMLFYVSGSYIPNQFSWQCLTSKKTFKHKAILPDDLPIDLILAFDYFGFEQMITKEELLEKILTSADDLEYNYHVLINVVDYSSELRLYIEKILNSKNVQLPDMVAGTAIKLSNADTEMAKVIAKLAIKKGVSDNIKAELIQKNIVV